ncbi:MAG: signal recognition particle receptor subunit beta [Planctomycetota bacterium]|jgi:signal recognition particle receptor subunit beta
MVQINFAQKSVTVKIVYYGPGMSGKTTNLEIVHQRAPEANKGDLTSISTDGDRTLFFDFMPLDLGTVGGMRTQFQIYTVPGQVYYNSTRKLVLQGVDGVIFVADSSASMLEENLESLSNLAENLIEYGKDIEEIPIVIQYNKRDLPDAMTVEELERHLNPRGAPSFEAMANSGHGVFPTLKSLAARVLDSIHEQTGATGAQGVAAPTPKPAVPAPPAAAAPAPIAMTPPPAVPLSAPAPLPAAAAPFVQAPQPVQPQAEQPAGPLPAPQQPAPIAMPAPFPAHAQAQGQQQQQQQRPQPISMSPVAPGPMPASPMPVAPMSGGLDQPTPALPQQPAAAASGLRMAEPTPHAAPAARQAPQPVQQPVQQPAQHAPAGLRPQAPAPGAQPAQQRPNLGVPVGSAPRPMAPAGSAPAPRAAAAAPAGRLRPRASSAAANGGASGSGNSKGALVTAVVVIAALAAGIAIGGTVFNLI